VAVAAIVAVALGGVHLARPHALLSSPPADTPPPAGGFFYLQLVGSYDALPGDAEAARLVHRSTWEPRPGNARYNRTVPVGLRLVLTNPADRAYDPRWNAHVLGRVTGAFTGTTDEIFQWAAAKWGLPDDLIRTVALLESRWNQANFGDYVADSDQCLPGFVSAPCPVTFGIVGARSTSWPGLFPWNRDSTAAGVDVLGAWLRGCYEGWVWWLRDHGNAARGVYAAGDIWGCVGAWFSGDWHDGAVGTRSGENYIHRAMKRFQHRPWLEPRF
jgi:autotransporter family porin